MGGGSPEELEMEKILEILTAAVLFASMLMGWCAVVAFS